MGKSELLAKMLTPVGKLLASVGPFKISNIIAEGEHVVVEAKGTGRKTISGKDYNNTYCFVMRMDEGKIVEVTEYSDTELVTEAFGVAPLT